MVRPDHKITRQHCVHKFGVAWLLHWDVHILMQKTILLVSRDQRVQADRALALSRAGYRTMRTGSLTSAVQLAASCQMAVIGNTFSTREQSTFVNDVREA